MPFLTPLSLIRPSGTKVAEGSNGFGSTYEVFLRPCSGDMLDAIQVLITTTVPDQLVIEPSELIGAHFINDDCKAMYVFILYIQILSDLSS